MVTIWAEQALLPDGWARDVTVTLADGRIASVSPRSAPQGQQVASLLPGVANLHSHAFQRAMAGLTEARGPDPSDTFWTWRQLMFRFLDQLTPDHVQSIAAFVQMEMLEAGFTCSVEFHYLHHRPGGVPYENPAEMAARIAAATSESGIGLTLMPVHYQFGGCDGRPLGPGQARFGTTPDDFVALWQTSQSAIAPLPADTAIGVAPHSLRATSPKGLAVCAAMPGPLHMHLAEQVAEVGEVMAHRGARPVEWLLDHAQVDPRWCLIHCTQMEPPETLALAATGAVAGLCPITEANLGDGVFDGLRWFGAGGRAGIGSDSNLRISLAEELRQLDHSQRLRDRSRAALATAQQSTGRRLYQAAAEGGAQAAGREAGAIAPGLWADLVALDGQAVDLEGLHGDTLLDAFVFAATGQPVAEVWSAGRHVVSGGRHRAREAITAAYRDTLRGLRGAL